MAGSNHIQIPQDLTKIVMIEVKDTSEPLRQFLTALLNNQKTLENKIAELEGRVTALE